MTYQEFIQNIIDTRGQWNIPDGNYYEAHHIIARCLGGLPAKNSHDIHELKHENLIWLYPQEHYIAHKLLAEENPDNKKIIFAFWAMSNSWNAKLKKYVIVTENDYAAAKQLLQQIKLGVPQPPALNKRRSDTMQAKKLIWVTNGEIELRCAQEECPPGFYLGRSDNLKLNNSKKCKDRDLHLFGEANGMYGKHHTDDAKQRISEYSTSCHWFNNGITEVFKPECPAGFHPGRLAPKKIIWPKWLLPDGTIREMKPCLVKRYHPDWQLLANNDIEIGD